jgi:catalase (peroxidase I)
MGPDGCLSSDPDHAGLVEENSIIQTILDPIWQKYCDKMSRGDFWALLAKLSIEEADPTGQITVPFQFGRIDSPDCSAGRGRLPNAQSGLSTVQSVFVEGLGLTMNE